MYVIKMWGGHQYVSMYVYGIYHVVKHVRTVSTPNSQRNTFWMLLSAVMPGF